MTKDPFDVTSSLFVDDKEDRTWSFIDKAFGLIWNFFAAIGMTVFLMFSIGYFMETWK
jgi:hypothetical protein